MAKRSAVPPLTEQGQLALWQYEFYLKSELTLRPATVRNYLSDMRQFMAWCEAQWSGESATSFKPERVTALTISDYRDYLQFQLELKPATVNRYLVSVKRYLGWLVDAELLARDPSREVKLLPETALPPRCLEDHEESALLAAVERAGDLRDRALVIVMLHTGLRVNEICRLRRGHINGNLLEVWGIGDHYREVPVDTICRAALQDYLKNRDGDGRGKARPTGTSVGHRVPQDHASEYLFPSNRTDDRLTPRAIGFLIAKYARLAGIENLRPHDLRHRFGYRMAETMPLDRLAHVMGHDLPESALIYVKSPPSEDERPGSAH